MPHGGRKRIGGSPPIDPAPRRIDRRGPRSVTEEGLGGASGSRRDTPMGGVSVPRVRIYGFGNLSRNISILPDSGAFLPPREPCGGLSGYKGSWRWPVALLRGLEGPFSDPLQQAFDFPKDRCGRYAGPLEKQRTGGGPLSLVWVQMGDQSGDGVVDGYRCHACSCGWRDRASINRCSRAI